MTDKKREAFIQIINSSESLYITVDDSIPGAIEEFNEFIKSPNVHENCKKMITKTERELLKLFCRCLYCTEHKGCHADCCGCLRGYKGYNASDVVEESKLYRIIITNLPITEHAELFKKLCGCHQCCTPSWWEWFAAKIFFKPPMCYNSTHK